MLRNLKISCRIRSQKTNDFESFAEVQRLVYEQGKKKFVPPFVFPHEDTIFEEKLYGKTCYIVGVTPLSLASSLFVKQAIKYSNAKVAKYVIQHIVLGGFNNSALKTLPLYAGPKTRAALRSNQLLYEPENMFCRQSLQSVINEQLGQNKFYRLDEKEEIITIVNDYNKCMETNDYFTATMQGASRNCKVSYGRPSDLIIFEDMMLRVPLNSLQEGYKELLNLLKSKSEKNTMYYPTIITNQLKYYSEFLPVFVDKDVTYLTALLNKYCSITDRVLMFAPTHFCEKIASDVHHLSINPKTLYRNYLEGDDSENRRKLDYFLNDQARQEKIEQLLEKMVILSIAKGNNLEIDLMINEKNIFEKSIFAPVFKHMTVEELIETYLKIRAPYMNKIRQIQNKRIQNILEFQPKGKPFLNLPEQFTTSTERRQKFPLIFQPDNLQIRNQEKIYEKKLKEKMQEIVENQYPEDDAKLYKQLQNGQYSKQSIILFSRLVGQAKIKLGLKKLKLPIFHYLGFLDFYKDYMKDQVLGNTEKYDFKSVAKKFKEKTNINMDIVDDEDEVKEYLEGRKGKLIGELDYLLNKDGHGHMQNQPMGFEEMKRKMDGSDEQLMKEMDEELKQYMKQSKE